MKQQTLALETRRGFSFSDYLCVANQQTVQLLKTFVTSASHQSVLLWGDSGLGKTHLLQASCLMAAEMGSSVHYIPLKQWISQPPTILSGLEQSDLLCIDDIDIITGHMEWEIAIFHLYNSMMERTHRLLFSARNAPHVLQLELQDLQSRLASSLILRLQDIDDEAKQKILRYRARHLGMRMPDNVSRYLMTHYNRDLPSLWMFLDKLDRETMAQQRSITLPFVKQVLEQM